MFPVADPELGWGGLHDLKSIRARAAAILNAIKFYRGRAPPPWIRYWPTIKVYLRTKYSLVSEPSASMLVKATGCFLQVGSFFKLTMHMWNLVFSVITFHDLKISSITLWLVDFIEIYSHKFCVRTIFNSKNVRACCSLAQIYKSKINTLNWRKSEKSALY